MQTQTFPSCCGASIIINLDSGRLPNDKHFYFSPGNHEKEFRLVLNKAKKPVYHNYNPAGGLTLLITNERQEWMRDILVEEGFIPLLDRFFNPIHKNQITLWGYITDPEKKGKLPLSEKSQKKLDELKACLGKKPFDLSPPLPVESPPPPPPVKEAVTLTTTIELGPVVYNVKVV